MTGVVPVGFVRGDPGETPGKSGCSLTIPAALGATCAAVTPTGVVVPVVIVPVVFAGKVVEPFAGKTVCGVIGNVELGVPGFGAVGPTIGEPLPDGTVIGAEAGVPGAIGATGATGAVGVVLELLAGATETGALTPGAAGQT
jgi:hypothetical protein